MLHKTKSYGQVMQLYAQTKKPLESDELLSWFVLGENIFATYGECNELTGIQILTEGQNFFMTANY